MRNPTEVLKALSERAAAPDYKFQRLYRNFYNPDFYYIAYNNICTNHGSMTAGVDGSTLEGMSRARIEKLIQSLKDHSYQPKPARREYIEKKSNPAKKRPLGIQSTEDKLVQEVARMLLESIYEPVFSNDSHGFRPKRSCHTALRHIDINFKGTVWFIEGDIKACFDSFDHHVLINALRKRIDDEYFIALIWKFLKAGYMEQWHYNRTYSGVPQGSGVSPILANIYLNELDSYIDDYRQQFERSDARHRKINPDYYHIQSKIASQEKKLERLSPENSEEAAAIRSEIEMLKKTKLKVPYNKPCDESYKSLKYCRYADDFIIGLAGSRADAERIKQDIKQFLAGKLKLELSDSKTKITHSTENARFLGYDITVSRSVSTKRNKAGVRKREYGGRIMLYVPKEKWMKKLIEYGVLRIETSPSGKEIWKVTHRSKLINNQDIEIITQFNAEVRGLYNYYCLANNASVIGKFAYIMEYGMYKTFANKYRTTMGKIVDRYKRDGAFTVPYQTKQGTKYCVFYDKGFKRIKQTQPDIADTLPIYRSPHRKGSNAARILAGKCELCGCESANILMHHEASMKSIDLSTEWGQKMKSMHRKSLAVCESCFDTIHNI